MKTNIIAGAYAFVFLVSIAGCSEPGDPSNAIAASFSASAAGLDAPSPLETVSSAGGTLTLWPFTGFDFSGTPQDPINLVFAGQTEPRALRAALLFLDGDRTAFGFPDALPFNCTWHDAIGGVQTAYGNPVGWVGSAIQLECGEYEQIRFHTRLFDLGDWTIAGAHMEVLIPGTTEHQVISWEVAEQLVAVDFVRTGLLDPGVPPFPSDPINPAPFRAIPAILYNGLPVELRAAIGGPLGDVTDAVPIGTDGRATILNVATSVESSPVVTRQEFVIDFDQVIPKPFCASGLFDFLYVTGPVKLRQQVTVTPSGNYVSHFSATGHLDLTPVNPLTDPPTPIRETYRATVNELHKGIATDNVSLASQFQLQIEIPPSGPFRGRLLSALNVGPGGADHSSLEVRCDP